MKDLFKPLLLLATAFSVVSCIGLQQNGATKQRVISEYNPYNERLHPELMIYHEDDEHSRLYSRIDVSELLYNRANKERRYEAKLRISYQLYNNPSQRNPKISNEATITLDSMHRNSFLTSYLRIQGKLTGRYYMEVRVKDLLQNVETKRAFVFDKSSPHNPGNYLLVHAYNQRPLFMNIVNRNDEIFVKYREKALDELFLDFYSETLPIAPPPFSSSSAGLLPEKESAPEKIAGLSSEPLTFNKEGIYFYRADTSAKQGFTVYNFGIHYPRVKTPAQMLGPLRYLLSSQEFKKLKSRSNLKLAIDNFWLGLASGTAQARQLIKIFYNRVTFANLYFTSLTQGWKTDRGMIYTVFGPPHAVKKGMDYETWQYGNRSSLNDVSFTFRKIDTPHSTNHYVLERKVAYEPSWSEAVDTWRKGEVFSF